MAEMVGSDVNLIVKVQEFEDKRIAAKASWNIKELKGKLSEIYPTSTEEQKLIYSGKLLKDTSVLKDILKEYEGLEAHTVHLVFTPKNLPSSSRSYSSSKDHQQKSATLPATSTSTASMEGSELRQRHTTVPASSSNNGAAEQTNNIPNNYYNAFYASGMDANSILAQQYAMQSWMQQAYAQYINQYMNIMSTPEAFQQQQQAQLMPNMGFLSPQMPLLSPPMTSTTSAESAVNNSPQQPEPINQEVPQPAQQPAVDAQQRRFPNIIQDEQENRDWLDILYSMSRLLILLCLVYFYSSPLRCCIVILIGVSIYLYHIYRQNQNRLNNNNTTRVNLNNVNRPVPPPQPQQADADVPSQQPGNDANPEESQSQVENEIATQDMEPQVPVLEVVKTFLVSFVASIIPTDPAI